jgi:hypothetical protein
MDTPLSMYQDNQSAIQIYNGGSKFKRNKHLLVKQEYIKDFITRNIVRFEYLNTNDMPADIGTKPVYFQQIQNTLAVLSMVRL